MLGFNSRSRGGSDRSHRYARDVLAGFQFTLPRGERHAITERSRQWYWVSIHAPAGGATSTPWRLATTGAFQFTLPRGERPGGHPPKGPPPCFNSRSRGGSDASALLADVPRGVSIHAPAGGATETRRSAWPRARGFNSRSRGGSDLSLSGKPWKKPSFNSRSRGGSDSMIVLICLLLGVFQFTLPRGERPDVGSSEVALILFQFTLPRGERPPGRSARRPAPSFNSRSRGGSDWAIAAAIRLLAGFNSRSRGGSDDSPGRGFGPLWEFQFTLPRGERR